MAEKAPSIFSQPPEFLYKYRSLQDEEHKRRAMEIITESKLYFSRPTDFNDPFDCKADKGYYDPKDEKEKRKMLERAFIRKFPDKSRQVCRQMAKKTNTNHETLSLTEDIQTHSINNSGVFSFSEEKDNILLWSHYADGHKGLCLGFAITKKIKSLFNITYQSERPQNGALKGSVVQFKDIVCTKSKDWAYEKAWRYIYTPSRDGTVGYGRKPFPKESLVGIIFGCEMPDKHKKEIVELVKKHRPTLELQQAEIVPGKFALTIKPYEY